MPCTRGFVGWPHRFRTCILRVNSTPHSRMSARGQSKWYSVEDLHPLLRVIGSSFWLVKLSEHGTVGRIRTDVFQIESLVFCPLNYYSVNWGEAENRTPSYGVTTRRRATRTSTQIGHGDRIRTCIGRSCNPPRSHSATPCWSVQQVLRLPLLGFNQPLIYLSYRPKMSIIISNSSVIVHYDKHFVGRPIRYCPGLSEFKARCITFML